MAAHGHVPPEHLSGDVKSDRRWEDTLLEVDPGILKRAGECSAAELDAWEKIQDEKDLLTARIASACAQIWARIEATQRVPKLPDWWVFAPELAWTDLISMRKATSELEAVVVRLKP